MTKNLNSSRSRSPKARTHRSLHPRQDPSRACLPISNWPELDRNAYEQALLPGDLLEPGGLAAKWSGYTRRKNTQGYGRWLTWLAAHDLLDARLSPTDRISRDRVVAYVRELSELNAPYTVLARIDELAHMIRVMVPDYDVGLLYRLAGRIRATAVASRNKRRRVMSSIELVEFGTELMIKADGALAKNPVRRAVLFRDGLMIALLAARPFRRRNFASLELGRHVIELGEAYWLRIAAEETKTKQPIDVPFPADLVPHLRRYLSEHRPVLARRTGRWNRDGRATAALWVSTHGSAMTEIAIYFRIMKLTKERFGHVVSPHLFRDCAATTIAIEDPQHVYCTKAVLGHGSLATSERHYNQAGTLEASRRLQRHVLELRRRLRGILRNSNPGRKSQSTGA